MSNQQYEIIDSQYIKMAYRNLSSNGHFFDKGTMSFFNSRLCNTGYKLLKSKDIFFITSEKNRDHDPRLYTIRKLEYSGNIETVGEFQQYTSAKQAKKDLLKIISEVTK